MSSLFTTIFLIYKSHSLKNFPLSEFPGEESPFSSGEYKFIILFY